MGYMRQLARSKFFVELSNEKRKEYFSLTDKKYLPDIDNIYYTIFLKNDISDNPLLVNMFDELECLRETFIDTHNEVEFRNGLYVKSRGYKMYRYCLSVENEYDVFILDYLPNDKTPRVIVQLRAHGLWTLGKHEMLEKSYNAMVRLFAEYGCEIEKCRENRIDYSFHTNIIQNPDRMLDKRYFEKHMRTTFENGTSVWHNEINDGELSVITHYVAMGQKKSNNVFVRIYDKTREVVEKGYKGMFFKIWREKGLINFYDEYCLRHAYIERSYDSIHKARLYFYIDYGEDNATKLRIRKVLEDKNSTAYHYREVARQEGLPDVTVVMNIEFQTMRKFYYYSDRFIKDELKPIDRPGADGPLGRIFTIIDNRDVFLKYLTSNTLCFVKERIKNKEKGEVHVYCDWWERLRNTKLDGKPADKDLVREYVTELDMQAGKRRLVGSVATNAVYNGKVDTEFVEDITDCLANFNDNDAKKMKVDIDGRFESRLLRDYDTKKQNKDVRLKSKMRKNAQRRAEEAAKQTEEKGKGNEDSNSG